MLCRRTLFIAYASASEASSRLAAEIVSVLPKRRYNIFFHEHDLPRGQTYDNRIKLAIKRSDGMVFLASNEAFIDGAYTLTELGYARRFGTKILPVFTPDLEMDSVSPDLIGLHGVRPKGNARAEVTSAIQDIWPVPGRKCIAVVLGGIALFGAAVSSVAWVCGDPSSQAGVCSLVHTRWMDREAREEEIDKSSSEPVVATRPQDAPAGAIPPETAADPSAYFREFLRYMNDVELRHIDPRDLLVLGGRDSETQLNTLPPRTVWANLRSLALVLDAFVDRHDHPIELISVYRNQAYNASLSGTRQSTHIDGLAADFRSSKGNPSDWADTLARMRAEGVFSGGIGEYRTFVHVDVRGTNATWGSISDRLFSQNADLPVQQE